MKYFIGQVASEEMDTIGEDGLFEYGGDYYYNMVEFGTNPGGAEDFVISDTCGRSVPISIEQLAVLIETLQDIQETLAAIENGKAAQAAIFDEDEIRTFEW